MKLTNSCALFAAAPLFFFLLASCNVTPLPAIACDTTTLVLSR